MREKRRGFRTIARVSFLVLLAALAVAATASAARPFQGKLDRSFGKGGRARLPLGPTFANSHFEAMVRQPDGGIVLAGSTEVVKGIYNEGTGFLQRRLPNGELDTGFGGGMVRVPDVGGLAAQGDGRVLVGAPESISNCGATSTVRRFLADGTPDPSFGENGTSAKVPLSARYLALDAEGRVVIAGVAPTGPCTHAGTPTLRLTLARLLPSGALDQSFGQGGAVSASSAKESYFVEAVGLAVREDGSILVAGRRALYAFTSAGAPDPGFGKDGVVEVSGTAGALLGLPGGKAALAGSSGESCCEKTGSFVVSRYLPNGSPDPEFGSGGSVSLAVGEADSPTALVAGPGDTILLGGEAGSSGNCPSLECDVAPFLARFTPAGELDPSFGQAGQATLDLLPRKRTYGTYVAALAVAPGGQVLVAGSSGDEGNATVSALQPNGAPDSGFGSGGRAADIRTLPSVTDAQDVAIARDGAIFVSGWSNAGDHRSRSILLGTDAGFGGGRGFVEPNVDGPLQVDGRNRLYSFKGSYSDIGRNYVTRFDEHGQRDLGYGSEGKAIVPAHFKIASLVVRRNGQALVVGRITDRFGMAAFLLSPSGEPVRRFGGDGLAIVGFEPKVKALALAATFDRRGRVVLFGNYGPYTGMARLLPNGRPDLSFAYHGRQYYMPGLDNKVSAIANAPDGGILVAAGPGPDLRPLPTTLIRFRPDGIRDRSFGHNGVVRVKAVAPMISFFAGRRLILVTGTDGFGEHGVAIRAFGRRGHLDRRFGRRGVVTLRTGKGRAFRPVAAARQPNGRIVVAGTRGLIEQSGSTVELLRFR